MAATMKVLNTCLLISLQFCDSVLGKRKLCQAKEMIDVRDSEMVKSSRGQGKVLPHSYLSELLIPCSQAPDSVADSEVYINR